MSNKFLKIILIAFLFFISSPPVCHAKAYPDVEDKIKQGQSKQATIELLGEPVLKTTFIKRNKNIWGPEEEFWDKIPLETKLEVWKYEFSDGNLNLYFVNGEESLGYKAFAPKGVVY
ncbi:MAG: hypothetical protein HY758_04155 [Nitrospirae bacterium]|nr:hypothetical protein [Nitrospirota bacterium]